MWKGLNRGKMPKKDEEEGGSSNKPGKTLDCNVGLIPMKRDREGQDWIFLREF